MMPPTVNFTGNAPFKADGQKDVLRGPGEAAFAKLMSGMRDHAEAGLDHATISAAVIAEDIPEGEQVDELVAEEDDALPLLPLLTGQDWRPLVVPHDQGKPTAAVSTDSDATSDGLVAGVGSALPDVPTADVVLTADRVLEKIGLLVPVDDNATLTMPDRANPVSAAVIDDTGGSRVETAIMFASQPVEATDLEPSQVEERPELTAEIRMQIGIETKGDIAAAHPPAAKSVPQLAHSVVRQIAVHAADQQGNRIEVTLTPEELGTVRLVISAGERPAVAVYADNPATLDLLRRHADLLARELRDTGFAGADLSFADNNGAGRRQAAADRGGDKGFSGDRIAPREEVQAPPVRPRPMLGSLIDIRI